MDFGLRSVLSLASIPIFLITFADKPAFWAVSKATFAVLTPQLALSKATFAVLTQRDVVLEIFSAYFDTLGPSKVRLSLERGASTCCQSLFGSVE